MKKIDSYQLGKNGDKRNEYHRLIENYLNNIEIDQTAGERWDNVKEVILNAATESVGMCNRSKHGRKMNEKVQKLSEKQKQIRIKIGHTTDIQKIVDLRKERYKTLKEIRMINNEEKEKELDEKILEIGKMKDSTKMLRAVR